MTTTKEFAEGLSALINASGYTVDQAKAVEGFASLGDWLDKHGPAASFAAAYAKEDEMVDYTDLQDTVDRAHQNIQAMVDEMHSQQEAAPPSVYVEVFAIPEMMIRRTCDQAGFALAEQSRAIAQLRAEVERLRALPPTA